MDLKGVVALVTGGNGGLGQRICHALAQEGARVAVLRGTLPARPTLAPCIRFLSIDSRVCSMLPSDTASRR
jgi:NAD(P)-dependent dehydrogenase (short-subunit alcohol dehydrogenase family)